MCSVQIITKKVKKAVLPSSKVKKFLFIDILMNMIAIHVKATKTTDNSCLYIHVTDNMSSLSMLFIVLSAGHNYSGIKHSVVML